MRSHTATTTGWATRTLFPLLHHYVMRLLAAFDRVWLHLTNFNQIWHIHLWSASRSTDHERTQRGEGEVVLFIDSEYVECQGGGRGGLYLRFCRCHSSSFLRWDSFVLSTNFNVIELYYWRSLFSLSLFRPWWKVNGRPIPPARTCGTNSELSLMQCTNSGKEHVWRRPLEKVHRSNYDYDNYNIL